MMKSNVNISSKSACDTPLQAAMPKFAGGVPCMYFCR